MDQEMPGNETEKTPEIEPVETLTLTGLYGSGKSTTASQLIEEDEDYVFVGSETAEIGMDGGAIPLPEERKKELQNVCMACNTEGEFDQAIEDIMETLDESDRVLVEGPGNAGTRNMAGTVSSLPELDQRYVGRMVNLENWEGEKAELKDEDLKAANFIAVNRPTSEHNRETVENYLEERGIETEVIETGKDGLDMESLEDVREWSDELLVESMEPVDFMGRGMPGDHGHEHKDTEYGRIDSETDLNDLNKVFLQIDEEDFEGLRMKINVGEQFVNVVNGELEVEEYGESAPGYLVASNFGHIPDSVKDAFGEIESLTSQSISPGASRESVKENMKYKLENARKTETSDQMSELPDIHSSAMKVAEEAREIWPGDNEVQELSEQVAQEYAETAMDMMYRKQDEPLALSKLASELHWASENGPIDTETGQNIAYRELASGLAEMDETKLEELNSYSDSEEFHEYFSEMLDHGLETGAITREEYSEARENITESLDEDELGYWSSEAVA